MPSTTKLATIAENLDIGLTGASDWTNLTLALNNDNNRAINNFNSGAGIGKSNYLYVNSFGMNLPSTAVVDGITVQVDRRGTGVTKDYYVGLVYNDAGNLQITTPGMQSGDTWPASDAVATYGSATELWNRSWTLEEINNSDFGFAISITGNPTNLDSGSIDYIQITVTYHHSYLQIASGGSKAAGISGVTSFVNEFTIRGRRGVKAAGHAGLIFRDTASGGIVGSGLSAVSNFYPATGGIIGSGASVFRAIFRPST